MLLAQKEIQSKAVNMHLNVAGDLTVTTDIAAGAALAQDQTALQMAR